MVHCLVSSRLALQIYQQAPRSMYLIVHSYSLSVYICTLIQDKTLIKSKKAPNNRSRLVLSIKTNKTILYALPYDRYKNCHFTYATITPCIVRYKLCFHLLKLRLCNRFIHRLSIVILTNANLCFNSRYTF